MKTYRRYCQKCKKETLHDEGYRDTTSGLIFCTTFLFGFNLLFDLEQKDRVCHECNAVEQIAGIGT